MVKNRNLKLLYDMVSEIIKNRLPGDIVECGVWNGGSAAIMGAASMSDPLENHTRKVWLFDSFDGLPPPSHRDGDLERQSYFPGWNRGHVKLVREVFDKLKFPSDNLRIVPGWFDQTIAREPIEKIAILHIDADWYESVRTVLELLYPRVVPGGYVVLDDFGLWPGCERAVEDYFAEHGISGTIVRKIGKQGAYFQKPL